MTVIASILFFFALAASVRAIAVTLNGALPRIIDVIEGELTPAVPTARRISFGTVKRRQRALHAEVVLFPVLARVENGLKLAA